MIAALPAIAMQLALFAGVWTYAGGLSRLRRDAGAVDLIACSLGLAILMLAGTAGWLMILAALPFVWLAMPQEAAVRDWPCIAVPLVFPAAFLALCLHLTSGNAPGDPRVLLSPDLAAPLWLARLVLLVLLGLALRRTRDLGHLAPPFAVGATLCVWIVLCAFQMDGTGLASRLPVILTGILSAFRSGTAPLQKAVPA